MKTLNQTPAAPAQARKPDATTHSPLPWDDDASKYPEIQSVRIFSGTHYIATVGNSDDTREQTEANATYIVRAVNNAQRLADALKAASDHLDYCGYGDKWERECAKESKLSEQISEALAECSKSV